jgi:uncharacterized membrane protein (UPF0127 family)
MRYANAIRIWRDFTVSLAPAAVRFDRAFASRFLAGLLFALAAFHAAAAEKFGVSQVKVGNHALKVEVAISDPQRMQGLMFREKLGRNDGMLFIFDEPAYQSMWMKNTLIPLSVAFIDRNGVILNILDMEPHTLTPNMSAGPALYALETNKGWFAENRIKAGDRVTNIPRASP